MAEPLSAEALAGLKDRHRSRHFSLTGYDVCSACVVRWPCETGTWLATLAVEHERAVSLVAELEWAVTFIDQWSAPGDFELDDEQHFEDAQRLVARAALAADPAPREEGTKPCP